LIINFIDEISDDSDAEVVDPLSGLLQEVYRNFVGGRGAIPSRQPSSESQRSTASAGSTTRQPNTSTGGPSVSATARAPGQMFSFTIPVGGASSAAAGVPFELPSIALEGIFQQLLTGRAAAGAGGVPVSLQGNFPLPFLQVLHGNPGDYAWGSGGLDTIITQLLNNLDGSGPPPMPKQDIQQLPSVQITEEDTSKNLQCTVCMEDFVLKESVRQLPCGHKFHDDCIIPWLEMHGSCPICRKLFNSATASHSDNSHGSEPHSSSNQDQPSSSSGHPNSGRSPSSRYHDINDYD
jgi:E3 ubiquitin-protein ligase RNF115/126